MNNYLLFAGDWYYPSGGYNDFRGAYDSVDLAILALLPMRFDWAHIVHDNQIVWIS